jgi:hypothetical protein
VALLSVRVLELRLPSLCLREGQPARAHLGVELILDPVDVRSPRIRLGPKVAGIRRVAAELEADQVVLLEVGGRPLQGGGAELLELEVDGRIVFVQPRLQIVERIVACVTSGFSTPGVSVQLATTAGVARRWRGRSSRRRTARQASRTMVRPDRTLRS